VTDFLPGGDVTWEVSEPPETTPLRASIDAFVASLTTAHPCIFMRPPEIPLEDIAALLHMSLEHCRDLLAAYDFLMSTDAVWLFDSPCVDEADDDDDDEHEADEDDIPF
jgi:hypothetical protein